MLIQLQTLNFVFIIVIIVLIFEYPDRASGEKCWNGLGFCDYNCGENDSKKIDYTCEESRTCCVLSSVVIPVKDIEAVADQTPGEHKCGLGHGHCHTHCVSPHTVYAGSTNECPHREFCCIPNSMIEAAPKEEAKGEAKEETKEGAKEEAKEGAKEGAGGDKGDKEGAGPDKEGDKGEKKEQGDKEAKPEDGNEKVPQKGKSGKVAKPSGDKPGGKPSGKPAKKG